MQGKFTLAFKPDILVFRIKQTGSNGQKKIFRILQLSPCKTGSSYKMDSISPLPRSQSLQITSTYQEPES